MLGKCIDNLTATMTILFNHIKVLQKEKRSFITINGKNNDK